MKTFLYTLCIAALFMAPIEAPKYKTQPVSQASEIIEVDTINYDSLYRLNADTLYGENSSSNMHFRQYEDRPDTVELVLVNDSNTYNVPVETGRYVRGIQRGHKGLDWSHNNKDTTRSCFGGVVRWSKMGYNGGYGNLVIVRHFNGLESYYAHHWSLLVEKGDTVQPGQPLGIVGSTGNSRGPHLHFELRFLGYPIDPFKIMSKEDLSYTADDTVVLTRYGSFYRVKQ